MVSQWPYLTLILLTESVSTKSVSNYFQQQCYDIIRYMVSYTLL
jgi:hypothetical protein